MGVVPCNSNSAPPPTAPGPQLPFGNPYNCAGNCAAETPAAPARANLFNELAPQYFFSLHNALRVRSNLPRANLIALPMSRLR